MHSASRGVDCRSSPSKPHNIQRDCGSSRYFVVILQRECRCWIVESCVVVKRWRIFPWCIKCAETRDNSQCPISVSQTFALELKHKQDVPFQSIQCASHTSDCSLCQCMQDFSCKRDPKEDAFCLQDRNHRITKGILVVPMAHKGSTGSCSLFARPHQVFQCNETLQFGLA